MKYSEGLSGWKVQINNNLKYNNKTPDPRIGRVYAIILDENTPSSEIFNQYGGWDALGTVFYLDYNRREDLTNSQITEKIKNNYFNVARPVNFNNKFFPLIGELIQIKELSSPNTSLSNDIKVDYYTEVVNYWNNVHHNADIVISSDTLGNKFKQRNDVRPLLPFQGDNIIESRNGAAIRLSSTYTTNNNWWSSGSSNGDPITIISNGLNFNSSSLIPHVEDVNIDDSFLLLTSTQMIPVITNKTNLNPLTKPIALNSYSGAQASMISDRVVLYSKKDDVLISAYNNIEIFTKNITNIDADNRITMNSPYIFMGLNNQQLPTEPAMLGISTLNLLSNILEALSQFSINLSVAISTAEGSPILDITSAAEDLYGKIDISLQNLTQIISKKVYIAT
jgi:hypothetical protein